MPKGTPPRYHADVKRLLAVLLGILAVLGGVLWMAWRPSRDLVEDLASPDPDVVVAAARRVWVDTLAGVDVGPDLARGLKHPSARVRSRCLRTLARLGRSAYVDDVVALLQDPDESVRIQAALALRELRSWKDPAPLIRVLLDERQGERIRVDVAWSLGERRHPAAEEPLARVAADPTQPPRVRQEALEALGALGAVQRVALLRKVLEAPAESRRVRRAAAKGLGQLRVPESRQALEDTLERRGDDELVRAQAARSLGCQREPAEIPRLRAHAEDPAEAVAVRLGAAQALHELGGPVEGLVDLVRRGLEDDNRMVRLEAACLADEVADPALVPALEAAAAREPECGADCIFNDALRKLRKDAAVDPDAALETSER